MDILVELQDMKVDFAFRLAETSDRLGNASISLAPSALDRGTGEAEDQGCRRLKEY